ncbi:MAG TPA: hypothetical protein VFH80_13605, partial [Solirubrobacteraceae bacterium]|nr:hypothetical protein [Solirubrobacteraceae bacterium]
IGTAHVEVKPVLNEEAVAALSKQIEDAVAAGVAAGLARSPQASTVVVNVTPHESEDFARFLAERAGGTQPL